MLYSLTLKASRKVMTVLLQITQDFFVRDSEIVCPNRAFAIVSCASRNVLSWSLNGIYFVLSGRVKMLRQVRQVTAFSLLPIAASSADWYIFPQSVRRRKPVALM